MGHLNILKFPSTVGNPDSVPPTETIDILILRTLASGGIWDAKAIARQWGEDEARVRSWLAAFVKHGLIVVKPLPGNKVGFHGHADSINDYIAASKNRAG